MFTVDANFVQYFLLSSRSLFTISLYLRAVTCLIKILRRYSRPPVSPPGNALLVLVWVSISLIARTAVQCTMGTDYFIGTCVLEAAVTAGRQVTFIL